MAEKACMNKEETINITGIIVGQEIMAVGRRNSQRYGRDHDD